MNRKRFFASLFGAVVGFVVRPVGAKQETPILKQREEWDINEFIDEVVDERDKALLEHISMRCRNDFNFRKRILGTVIMAEAKERFGTNERGELNEFRGKANTYASSSINMEERGKRLTYAYETLKGTDSWNCVYVDMFSAGVLKSGVLN